MKKTPRQIADAIKNNPNKFNEIKASDNYISIMIIITSFIVDFDPYYIEKDKDIHPNLWSTVHNML